eukprot:TRINITY_DN5944_c0_g1_i1.p1 TRINITY_DN5944_c0_g1~~TRINITY_DN5944_c0_g1_i1.p1  ORF type:complete len:398 (-),score=79.47 TRINITY_DN5944_c0_g1_i1:4-1197(-)
MSQLQQKGHWIIDTPIANPMSIYPQYRRSRTSWGIGALGTVIVETELENGMKGIGVSIGGPPACYIIENHLSRFLEGQPVQNVELMWDQMFRATLPYGRKGLALNAISAVDLSLWDLLGKLRNEPVYNLLGGKTKDRLPVYDTTAKPGIAKSLGFQGSKFPLPYNFADDGITDNKAMKQNIEFIKSIREEVGPDFPLMIDCYMSLTVNQAIHLGRAVKRFGIKWIEEFLPPDDLDGYSQVRQALSHGSNDGSNTHPDSDLFPPLLLTTGEHEYTRYGFRELISRKCVDILQPDVTWVGGITEAKRIVAMASAYDIPVIPHGSGVFSYHLQMANTNCPMVEYLVMSPEADKIVPCFGNIFVGEPLPKDGWIDLPSTPGFGIELNPEVRSTLQRPYPRG